MTVATTRSRIYKKYCAGQHGHHTVQRPGKFLHRNRGIDDPALSLNVNGLECHHALYSGKPWIIPDIGVDHTGTGGVLRLLLIQVIHAGKIQLRVFFHTVIKCLQTNLILWRDA